MSAADLIRQHLEALPERARYPWHVSWMDDCGDVLAMDGKRAMREVCVTDSPAEGAYIALLASPHVAEALAELLDRYHEMRRIDAPVSELDSQVRALEAAISREGRSDGA